MTTTATTAWAITTAASTAAIVADFDPTMQPTRASFWPFLFVAIALALLMVSMVRHLRRARENLGPVERAEHPGFTEAPEPGGAPTDPHDRSR